MVWDDCWGIAIENMFVFENFTLSPSFYDLRNQINQNSVVNFSNLIYRKRSEYIGQRHVKNVNTKCVN